MLTDNDQGQILRQNYTKAFFSKFLLIISFACLIVLLLFVLDYMIGIDVLMTPLEVFNIKVDTTKIMFHFVFAVVGIALLFGITNIISVRSLKYIFYDDQIVIKSSNFLTSKKEIPFQNITNVDSNKDGLFNTIFNSGTVVLYLNNIDQKQVKLSFIDDPLEVGNYVQSMIRKNMSMQQAELNEGVKMKDIVGQL